MTETSPDTTNPRNNDARRILVIDTDPGVRWALEKGLANSGYNVQATGTVEHATHIAESEDIAGVLMELDPDAGLTLDVLSLFVKSHSAPRVLCSAVDSKPQTVIECMRRGAVDFIPKPFSLAEVRAAFSRVLSSPYQGSHDAAPGAGAQDDASLIIGVSQPIQELRSLISLISKTDLNCLIRGESGVGKDIVAREIHRQSARHEHPFIKVNCSALPEQLLESELFGFEKGAFTGAIASKPGRFSLADKGIIFLDEIGEMHPDVQVKLLQVIEHKEFTKLGGRKPIKVDTQILAATNANLEAKTKDGSFRQDLFFRLNEVSIWVPPLATRKEDVPLLVRHFIQKYKHFAAAEDTFNDAAQAIAILSEREWPGNVRELESAIKRWLVLGRKGLATLSAGPTYFPDHTRFDPAPQKEASPLKAEISPETIFETLEEFQWNRRKAAEALGMSYQALRRRIEKHNLDQKRR